MYSNNSIEEVVSKFIEYSRINLSTNIMKDNFKLSTQLNKPSTFFSILNDSIKKWGVIDR